MGGHTPSGIDDDGIEIDLLDALAAAVGAARKAAQIIWAAVAQRRAAVAAAHAPVNLPLPVAAAEAEDGRGSPAATAREVKKNSKKEEEDGDGETPTEALASPTPEEPLQIQLETKDGATDFVTEYDRLCDTTIIQELGRYCDRVRREKPHIAFHFITEELSPSVPLTDELTWIVDPIDGTTSFIHGLPDCCVSIGLAHKKRPVLAVVLCPFLASGASVLQYLSNAAVADAGLGDGGGGDFVGSSRSAARGNASSVGPPSETHVLASAAAADNRPVPQSPFGGVSTGTTTKKEGEMEMFGELFTAVKGRGCYLNAASISVNTVAKPQNALVTFNYPYNVRLSAEELAGDAASRARVRAERYDSAVEAAGRVIGVLARYPVPGLRMYGSCVTTLAQLAAGRVDAYAEPAGRLWDVCAGALLVTEAGGVVTNIQGEPFDMSRDTTICAGANAEMVKLLTDACVAESYGQYWQIPPPKVE